MQNSSHLSGPPLLQKFPIRFMNREGLFQCLQLRHRIGDDLIQLGPADGRYVAKLLQQSEAAFLDPLDTVAAFHDEDDAAVADLLGNIQQGGGH